MRETSHEKGRRQLLRTTALLQKMTSARAVVTEVGNAYSTSMMTSIPSAGGQAFYDAVIRVAYADGRIEVCCIESKFAATESTVAKLPSQFSSFVVKAYEVVEAWRDDWERHRPVFLFVASNQFKSPLYFLSQGVADEICRLIVTSKGKARKKSVERVREQIHILIFLQWLQNLIGH